MTFIGSTENSLEVKINFQEPDHITHDILDPDELIIKIIGPELIQDAETGEYLQLDSSSLEYRVFLTPQFTEEDLKLLEELKQTAVKVGGALAIWQIIILLVANKVLKKVWLLINCLQFFVYIAIWQVNYPKFIKLLITELRRTTLGEFMDDLEIGQHVSEFLNIPLSKKDDPQE